jgi:TatD DNase family protein
MRTETPRHRGALVDAHCHIDLLKDPISAVARAESDRVHTVAVTNAPSVFFHTRDLCRGKQFVHAALGLHPELIASNGHELPKFWEHISETKFIGEIGLDYVTPDEALRKKQRQILALIVQHASEAGGRILTVHSRRAAADVIDILGAAKNNTAILHWYSGTRKELERALERGLHFSVNAAMLSSRNGLSIVEAIPRERILTETDAPFARVAGRPSIPEDIDAAVKLLASTWNTTEEEAGSIVESNFNRILQAHGTSG